MLSCNTCNQRKLCGNNRSSIVPQKISGEQQDFGLLKATRRFIQQNEHGSCSTQHIPQNDTNEPCNVYRIAVEVNCARFLALYPAQLHETHGCELSYVATLLKHQAIRIHSTHKVSGVSLVTSI